MGTRLSYFDSNGGQPDVGTNNPLPTQVTGSNVKDVSLLTANTTATGTGTAQPVGGFKTLRLEVWGTGSFTVQIQVNNSTNGSSTYYVIQPVNLTSNTPVTSITVAGVYDIDVAGFSNVQANVTAVSGGNVNAAGKWVA